MSAADLNKFYPKDRAAMGIARARGLAIIDVIEQMGGTPEEWVFPLVSISGTILSKALGKKPMEMFEEAVEEHLRKLAERP